MPTRESGIIPVAYIKKLGTPPKNSDTTTNTIESKSEEYRYISQYGPTKNSHPIITTDTRTKASTYIIAACIPSPLILPVLLQRVNMACLFTTTATINL
jgi:hypothetical protein